MSLKIAIDLDNTVISTTETLVKYINERLPVNLTMDDITTYSIEAALPEQFRWVVDNGFRDKNMWKGVHLLPDCVEVIETLYNDGHEIFFATSSLPENLRKKINHLSRNMPFFPKDYVWKHTINIQDKYLLNVDILIDDCLEHALHPLKQYESLLIDYPWNRGKDVDGTNYVIRVFDWWDIYRKIEIFNKARNVFNDMADDTGERK